MTFRTALFSGLAALMLAGPASADPGSLSTGERAELVQTCTHYVNRARFKERGEEPEFVVILADSCQSAVHSLSSTSMPERMAARHYLARMRALRDTIIEMNMERVFGENYSPYTRIGGANGAKTEPVDRVSATGEYLIAHRMGLLHAFRAWLDTGPEFASRWQRKG